MARQLTEQTLDALAEEAARMLRSLASYLLPGLTDEEIQERLDEWSSIERTDDA